MPRESEDGPRDGGTRTTTEGRRGNGRVGFRLSAYDHDKPVVIDPVLSYSTYLGGSLRDEGNAITVERSDSTLDSSLTVRNRP